MRTFFPILFLLIVFVTACSNNGSQEENTNIDTGSFGPGYTQYDLSEHEIPVVIAAPMEAKVSPGVGNGAFGGVRTINYEVVKDKFVLDVNHIVGAKYSLNDLMTSEKLFAKELDGFAGFIMEEENGFIYKINTEEGDDFGFYYVLFKNEEPVEFGVGFTYESFTLEQVELMYKVAKAAK